MHNPIITGVETNHNTVSITIGDTQHKGQPLIIKVHAGVLSRLLISCEGLPSNKTLVPVLEGDYLIHIREENR